MNMLGKIVIFFAALLVMFSCGISTTPEIRTLCLRDDIGNYIIKWETFPQIEGYVRIYASDVPDYFEQKTPAGIANIKDGITTYITIDNITRKYFLLKFNDQYQEVIGARAVNTDNIQNFREIGGYLTENDKMLKWGHIFRSGNLDHISPIDKYRIENLNVHTIIDLRTPEEILHDPIIYPQARKINIPISAGKMKDAEERIKQGRMKKGDGVLFLQDVYLQFIEKNSEQFALALDLFTEKSNYPILFHGSTGKDRTGFLTALLLAALDVPEETIMKDYLLSNRYININQQASYAKELDSDAQETITTLYSANELFLDIAFKKIKKEHGTIQKYLKEKLNFTSKKREKLKEIMLYE